MNSKLATFLKYCIYSVALVPLIIFSQYISPFHFGKVIVFRSLIEIMAVLYIFLVWNDRSYRPRPDIFFWAIFAFAIAYSITTFTGVDVYQSFWGTLERMGGMWSFWHYVVFYLIMVSILRTGQDWYTFLKVTVLVGVVSAFYGFGQRTNLDFFIGSGNRERIFGTIGNAALFAGYQIFNVFLSVILGLIATKKKERNFFLICAGIMSVAVLLTAVRGSIAGLILGLLLFALLYFYRTNSKQAKKLFIWSSLVLVVLVGLALALKNTSFVQDSPYFRRVTDFSVSSYTVQTRTWAWKAGLTGWSENSERIIFGWGPENFDVPFSKYFNPLFFRGPGSETLFDRAHNMFVEILVTTGLLGFLTYLGIFIVMFREMWRLSEKPEYRVPALALIGATLAYIIHNSFIFDTSANFIVFFTLLGFMSFMVRGTQNNIQPDRRYTSPALKSVVAAVLLVLVGFLIYETNIVEAKANYAATRGIVYGWQGDFNSATQSFQTSIDYATFGKFEERNRFAQYLIEYSADNKVTDENVRNVYKTAIADVQKNIDEFPVEYLSYLYNARLNIILGKESSKSPYNDEALNLVMRALKISPTFVRSYYELGQVYINKGDLPKAADAFQKALDLNPDVSLSYWYLGVVKLQQGDAGGALVYLTQALDKGYLPAENEYQNLVGLYAKTNDYKHLAMVYEGLTNLKPDNAQYHASLAVVYAKLGRIQDAVDQAHKAATLDPNFVPEAQKFVQQIGGQW